MRPDLTSLPRRWPAALPTTGSSRSAPTCFSDTATERRMPLPPGRAGDGGVSDDSVVADAQGALTWLKSQPTSNGKAGVIGPCSGGRHAVLVASRIPEFNAVVDLWGGGVVMAADQLTEKRPVAPIDLTPNLNAPRPGIFGNY